MIVLALRCCIENYGGLTSVNSSLILLYWWFLLAGEWRLGFDRIIVISWIDIGVY